MTRSPFSSLRFRLLLLVLLAIIPSLILLLYNALNSRHLESVKAQENAMRLAQLTSSNQERLIQGSQQLLSVLAQLPIVRDRDAAACNELVRELLEEYPSYASIAALEPDGDVFCSATPLTQPMNASDRPWFQRTIQTRSFTVGEYQIGRATNKASISVAYPVFDAADQLQAVVVAALDLEWLNQLFKEVELPPNSTLIVVDRNGTILVQQPNPEMWVGQVLADTPVIKTILSQRQGTSQTTGLDGVTRFYSFTALGSSLQDNYAYVSIGISREVAFAAANQLLVRSLISLGAVTTLAFVAVWVGGDVFLLRQVKGLLDATLRISGGNLSARTGLSYGVGELSQLAHAFDEMAETLEHRASQLRDAEAKYRALVEQIPAVVYTATQDQGSRMIYVSPQIEKLLGFSATAWLEPQHWQQQIHPEDRDRLLKRNQHNWEIGVPFTSEYRMINADGQEVWVRDEAQVIQGVNANPLIQGILLNITERKKAEAYREKTREALRLRAEELSKTTTVLAQTTTILEKRNQELDQFAYVISHDLKAPLRAIANLSEWIEEDLTSQLTPDTQHQMNLLRQRVHRMEALIEGLLHYSRAGRVDTPLETVSVEALLTEVIDSLAPPPEFKVEIGPGMPTLQTESLLLKQVFANLISNAVKHHDRLDGRIQILVKEQEEFYRFTVVDNGPGIDPKYHNKIFVIFQTLEARDKVENTGIGLSMVKKIVENQGGTIWVESQLNQGAAFHFTWSKLHLV